MAIREETTKRANCCGNGKLPLFYIEKDTRVGVLYAPFACVLVAHPNGFVVSKANVIAIVTRSVNRVSNRY